MSTPSYLLPGSAITCQSRPFRLPCTSEFMPSRPEAAGIQTTSAKGQIVLIDDYELKRIPGGCDDDAQTVSVQATLPRDVSAVYPYVNAILPGCSYNHLGRIVHWQEGPHKIVLRERELAVSGLPDWAAAKSAVAQLVDYLNQAWRRREMITPREQPRPQPTPIAVFKLLPGTNCRACGHSTCYAFALQLITRSAATQACPPLLEPEWERHLSELHAMLVTPPAVLFP